MLTYAEAVMLDDATLQVLMLARLFMLMAPEPKRRDDYPQGELLS